MPAEHHRLVLSAPEIARAARPGQFVQVWCHNPDEIDRPPTAALLRRPYSISRLHPPDGIEILLRVRGAGGALLARTTAGQALDVIGPLGRGFRIPATLETAVIVAGGIGLAPAPFLISTLAVRQIRVICLVGGANDLSLPYRVARPGGAPAGIPDLASLGAEVTFVGEQEDGALVTELLESRLDDLDPEGDQIMAVGPRAMMARIVELVGGRLPLQVSLEERMACGLGACRSCVVPAAGGGYVTVCREGPVFDAAEIDWGRLDP